MSYMKFALPLLLAITPFMKADEAVSEKVEQKPSFRRLAYGFDLFWIHYGVKSGGCDWQKNGYYAGIKIDEKRRNPNAFYAGVEATFAWGENHFRKECEDWVFGHFKEKQRATAFWMNTDVGYGYTFQPSLSPHFLLSVFAGPGTHFESRNKHAAAWWYGMTGFKATQDIGERFNLGFDFKTMYSFATKDRHGITFTARTGEKTFWGVEVGLPMMWKVGSSGKFDICWKPYLLKFNVNSIESILGSNIELGYTF